MEWSEVCDDEVLQDLPYEVWFCDEEGKVRFYAYGGEMPKSEIFDTFPGQVVTDFPYGK